MFIKVLIFISASFLVSCSPPPSKITPSREEDNLSSEGQTPSDEKFTNWGPSREHFQFELKGCKGANEEHFAIHSNKSSFLDITANDGKVYLSRTNMTPSLSTSLTADWDHSSGQLTNISGEFSISEDEDWSHASGYLHISNEGVVGSISGISIKYVDSNENGHFDVTCSVALQIGSR